MEPTALPRLYRLALAYAPYIGALAVRGLEVVGKLGLFMLAARLLGTHEAGLYFICLTWVGLASTIARAGFEKASVRHIAAEIAVHRPEAARRAMRIGLGWTALGGALATLATLLMAAPVAAHLFHDPDLAAPLRSAALAILPQALCFYAGHVLLGLNRGVAGQFVQNASWPSFTLAAMLAGAHSLGAMLYALALANLAAAAIGAALIARARWQGERAPSVPAAGLDAVPPGAEAATPPPRALPELWRTALPLGLVEVVQVSLNSIPMLLLAVFASAAEVGAFSIANRLSILVWVVIIAIGSIAAPRFAALHRLGDWTALKAQNRRVRRLVALVAVPPVAVMMVLPGPLLALIGPGFEIAAPALIIMAAGQLVNGLFSCQDIMLAMTGHGGLLRWLNLAQFVVCCAAGAVLIPLYGMNGAAILTALVIVQGALGTALAVRRLMPQAF